MSGSALRVWSQAVRRCRAGSSSQTASEPGAGVVVRVRGPGCRALQLVRAAGRWPRAACRWRSLGDAQEDQDRNGGGTRAACGVKRVLLSASRPAARAAGDGRVGSRPARTSRWAPDRRLLRQRIHGAPSDRPCPAPCAALLTVPPLPSCLPFSLSSSLSFRPSSVCRPRPCSRLAVRSVPVPAPAPEIPDAGHLPQRGNSGARAGWPCSGRRDTGHPGRRPGRGARDGVSSRGCRRACRSSRTGSSPRPGIKNPANLQALQTATPDGDIATRPATTRPRNPERRSGAASSSGEGRAGPKASVSAPGSAAATRATSRVPILGNLARG